jgi:hypothetical protein
VSAHIADEPDRPVAAPTRVSPDAFEIHLEALLLVRLECHLWKAHFIQLAGRHVPDGSSDNYLDIWELMLAEWIPPYSPERFEQFKPLFDNALKDMRMRFERLLQVYDSVLPRHVKKRLSTVIRQLDFAIASYRWIPARSVVESPEILFRARFKAAIRLMSLIARDADQRLAAMVDS